ncbi:uncharacterized protein LOC122074273 [Macadamia integrifolia]|uniref:uncharacterized protein LOC122074273 n=1 Tax=Macadamia integrifolia TaxID=60698 RepID=UPI001C4FB5BC|nr:uncharacterized protein LOC122074273 [Macadamia integrifolia]
MDNSNQTPPYVRVVKASAGMNPELSCTDASGKAAGFGLLKDGCMFGTSTGLSRMLLCSPTCPVLEGFGKKLSFEIAVGLMAVFGWKSKYIVCNNLEMEPQICLGANAKYPVISVCFGIWVNAVSASTVILVVNAIMNSESLSSTKQKIMVEKLLQRFQ